MKLKVKATGEKLLPFLRGQLASEKLSVKALKRSIDQKRCRVNGVIETFSTHPLRIGDVVEVELAEKKTIKAPLVLWEDEALIAYDKPAGVVSVRENFAGELVHRLDKETSGVMLVAKNKRALEAMIDLFKEGKVKKEYLAIVEGKVREKKKTVVSNLAPRYRFDGQVVYASAPKGKEATTEIELQAQGETASLLLCRPITGRTHQIRVHLKEMGYPVLGDYHYAKQFAVHAPRHMLHAHRIFFPHPFTGIEMAFTAPIPSDFAYMLELNEISHY
jgi:23S rRNA-/tRNA-specific pseudouridylate synthase